MKSLIPILAFLRKSRNRFIATADEIPDTNWLQSPSTDVWSAAEVLAHVAMIEESIMAGCKKVSQSAPRHVPVLKKIHPPLRIAVWRGRKIRSPIPIDPERVYDRQKAYEALGATRQSSVGFMESLRDQDLRAYRFPHPVFGSLNLYDWYRFIGYHELRHEKQIRELVEIFHR
jgi:hypothetical protein